MRVPGQWVDTKVDDGGAGGGGQVISHRTGHKGRFIFQHPQRKLLFMYNHGRLLYYLVQVWQGEEDEVPKPG